jgi:ParB-like chromosome segregation protein Spo0J
MSNTIADLTPDPKNRRKHNERNIGMIVSSLQQVGAARSIVIDEDNNILAGNGTVEAAQLAGIERLRIIDADGEEIIAVRRTGLTDEQKRQVALYDNRTAELAGWNPEQMLEDINAGLDFDGMFSKAELDELLNNVNKPEFTEYNEDITDNIRICVCTICGNEHNAKKD